MTVTVGSDIWLDYVAPSAGVVIVLLAVVVFVYGIGFNRKVAEPVFLDLQSPDTGKKQQKKKQKSKNEKKVRVKFSFSWLAETIILRQNFKSLIAVLLVWLLISECLSAWEIS